MILLAFDKFRGALGAAALADIAEQAIRDRQADAQVHRHPLSDGGEGFLLALDANVKSNLQYIAAPARDAGGRWRKTVGYRFDPGSSTAFIETSLASGWDSLATASKQARQKQPMTYATWGSGDLAQHAIQQGATRIVFGLGGSCSTDGGLGALEALGFQFFDSGGDRLEAGGASLQQVHHIRQSMDLNPDIEWVLACDVQHRYAESATAFGPQKGASPAQVAALQAGLQHTGTILEAFGRRPMLDRAMTGSCGGLAGGLHALLGASLQPGFDYIAELTHLDAALKQADIVLTGEGQVDAGSAGGKLLPSLARRAARHGVPVIAFAGRVEGNPDELRQAMGLAALHPLSAPDVPVDQAIAETSNRLRQAVQKWHQSWC